MATPTYYCWSCYAPTQVASGVCERCGGHIEAPPDARYADLLVWALDHPLAERRLLAAWVLGQRREARAEGRLRELVWTREDPYLAAAAVQALVAIVGLQSCTGLLADLAEHGPAPVRRAVRGEIDVLSEHDEPRTVGR
jgi:hypothetical protein